MRASESLWRRRSAPAKLTLLPRGCRVAARENKNKFELAVRTAQAVRVAYASKSQTVERRRTVPSPCKFSRSEDRETGLKYVHWTRRCDYARLRTTTGHRSPKLDNANHTTETGDPDRPTRKNPSASLCTRSSSSSSATWGGPHSLLRPPLLLLLCLRLRTFVERFQPPRTLLRRRLGRRRQPAERLARFRQRRGCGRRRRRWRRGSRRRFGRIAAEGSALLWLREGALLNERLCRASRQRRLKLLPRTYRNRVSCVSESQMSPDSRFDSPIAAAEDAVTWLG